MVTAFAMRTTSVDAVLRVCCGLRIQSAAYDLLARDPVTLRIGGLNQSALSTPFFPEVHSDSVGVCI